MSVTSVVSHSLSPTNSFAMDETMDIKTNNAPKLILLATINYYPAECY